MQMQIEPVASSRTRRDSRVGERFAFAGIAFELLAERDLEAPPSLAALLRPSHGPSADRTVANVMCSVVHDPSLAGEVDQREVRWQWQRDGAFVETGCARINVAAMSNGRYAASARIAPSDKGLSALAYALSATLVEREGGVVMHAAGVALDDKAYLFVGPSGAGKSTAASMVEGASWLAGDRVVVYPRGDRFLAWPLPGGHGPSTAQPLATEFGQELVAILRVHQGSAGGVPSFTPLAPAATLVALRESAMTGAQSEGAQGALLGTLTTLADRAAVGRIDTVLGQPLAALLRSLEAQGSAGARTRGLPG